MPKSKNNAASLVIEEIYRDDFGFHKEIPPVLQPLLELSNNYYWSWHPKGTELFSDLDAGLWNRVEQNPREFLKNISSVRLWQKSADQAYLNKLNAFSNKFEQYISAAAPAEFQNETFSKDNPIAYFCAEYGVHNSLPNYSGGLGILAGDHLKSASDMNVPLLAIGLFYRFGYFRQSISHDGWQEERYTDLFKSELALEPVKDVNGERIVVSVTIRGREVFAQAWRAAVGRISLYLLDTNLKQNNETDRLITGHLYGGNTETRIVQEQILGIGGVRLLRKLGVSPGVFHLNEGHSAFLTLELLREHFEANSDHSAADGIKAVREQCVFTTHTPVAAGNDVFSPDLLRTCFDNEFIDSLRLSEGEFLALGRADLSDESEPFGMTPFALRMCRTANGVSEKHGEVSRGLWKKMFQENAEVPITHVTNGVHVPTWVAPVFQEIFEDQFGADWAELTHNAEAWTKKVNSIASAEIWRDHIYLKNLLVAFIRERTRAKETGEQETINEHTDTSDLCSPDILTIGFARRVAQYKRWDLILSDLDRLLRMVDNKERPVQFIFAGKAHPQDNTAKKILQSLMSINHDSNWQKRAVFLEDYDQEVARYLVQGVDVWMNVPRRPHEASGTSGMKAAMNGVLNFSILDGWWIEGYNEKNGFAIGDTADFEDDAVIDKIEAEALYSMLENEVIPMYYERDENGLPVRWIEAMKDSMATLINQFSSDRMVKDYVDKIYTK